MRGVHALVAIVVGMAGCRCGETTAPPAAVPPAKDAAVVAPVGAPITQAESDAALACLIDRANSSRAISTALVEAGAAAPLVRRAVDAAIARAARDGESPKAMALSDAVEAYMKIGDRDRLRATFQQIDAMNGMTGPNSLMFTHHAAERTRAGHAVADNDMAGEQLDVVRERALAGDKAGAARLYDQALPTLDVNRTEDHQVAALVAINRIADAKAVIAAAPAEARLKIAGAWLAVALRESKSLDEALHVVLAELAVAPERGLVWFGDRELFRQAARAGRGRELAPLYKALRARYATNIKDESARIELTYDLAVIVGDADDVRALAADPKLAYHLARTTGPLDVELAHAKQEKYPNDDFARVWARATMETAPPGFGAALVATVCPPPPPKRGPATPPLAGTKLVMREKSRGMREECALHDVVITLTDARGKKLGTETIEGECTGACTAAEKRAGQKQLDEIEGRIETGEASNSETDYNFTDCMFRGPDEGTLLEVPGREVALIPIHGVGPHDVPRTSYVLALEVCGQLRVLDGFGTMYAHNWEPDDLTLRESADKTQLIVDGKSDFWVGVVYRVTMPECPGEPETEALQTE